MPSYDLKCRQCSCEFERLCPFAERNLQPCPSCGKRDSEVQFKNAPAAERQFVGQSAVSLTEGCHPRDVEMNRRLYPGTKITDRGDFVFHTRSEARRFQKQKAAVKRQSL